MLGSPMISWILVAVFILVIIDLYRIGARFEGKKSPGTPDSGPESDQLGWGTHFSRSYIITHSDFDGFASGALLLRYCDMDAGIRFATPRSITHVLQQTAPGLVPGDRVLLADLPFPPESEHLIHPVLKQLSDRGVNVSWYDHHQWPQGLIERTSEVVSELEIDITARTAAEMIRKKLPPEDAVADRIIRFLQNGSFPEDKEWDKAWRMLLSELTNQWDADLAEHIVQVWAEGGALEPAMEFLIRKGLQREQLTRETAKLNHRRESTHSNRKFIIIDLRSRRLAQNTDGKPVYVLTQKKPTIMVGALACREHQADFCLVVWDVFRYSLYRGQDRNIDFSPLFPEFRINNLRYSAGGHAYAASVRVDPPFLSKLKGMFRWRLPDEAEQLITFIRKRF